MNNFLFNINTLTISVFTGLVAASSKASLDHVVNGNYQIAEAGHTVRSQQRTLPRVSGECNWDWPPD